MKERESTGLARIVTSSLPRDDGVYCVRGPHVAAQAQSDKRPLYGRLPAFKAASVFDSPEAGCRLRA